MPETTASTSTIPPRAISRSHESAPSVTRSPQVLVRAQESATIHLVWQNMRVLKHSKSPRQIHPRFPTVMLLGSHWIELRCKERQANAGRNSHDFFSTLRGMSHHINYAHFDAQFDDITKNCQGRLVSARDVVLLKNGEEAEDVPIVMVPTRGHMRVRSARERRR
jgi:hypothetical protein